MPKINGISCTLTQLIGPRSWLLFDLLGLKRRQDWLQLKPKDWPKMEDYTIARDFVVNLEVVNDSAERGVKMISDFKDCVRDEKQRQFILQVVEDQRQRVESFNKADLKKL